MRASDTLAVFEIERLQAIKEQLLEFGKSRILIIACTQILLGKQLRKAQRKFNMRSVIRWQWLTLQRIQLFMTLPTSAAIGYTTGGLHLVTTTSQKRMVFHELLWTMVTQDDRVKRRARLWSWAAVDGRWTG